MKRIHLMTPEMQDSQGGYTREVSIRGYLESNFADEIPPTTTYVFTHELEVSPGLTLHTMAWGDHIFVTGSGRQWGVWNPQSKAIMREVSSKPFLTAEIVGDVTTKKITRDCYPENRRVGWHQRQAVPVYGLHGYTRGDYRRDDARPDDPNLFPYLYMTVKLTAEGADPVTGVIYLPMPLQGVATLIEDGKTIDVTYELPAHNFKWNWKESLLYTVSGTDQWNRKRTNPLEVLYRHAKHSTLTDGIDEWWVQFFRHNESVLGLANREEDGLKAVLKKKDIAANMERLKKESPDNYLFFRWLMNHRTVSKQCNNKLLAAMLRTCGADYSALQDALQTARIVTAPEGSHDHGWRDEEENRWFGARRFLCLSLPGAKEKVQEQEAKADYRKRKTNEGKAEGLGIDAAEYPKLFKAVKDGNLPASIFAQPDGTAVNREFPLWEKALRRKGWDATLFQIAKDAGGRSTYEKDITPYLNFLFKIETYLTKHTGGTKFGKWKAVPKYVQSQWELEMDDEAGQQTSTKRSAFTPTVDNDTRTVTVPYVAVCVSGVRTQWCYARHYHLFEEGLTDPESGGIVLKDYEEKLNGRDDYGLCYYTLTGTVTARGYPTFLIIFERLNTKTPEELEAQGLPACRTRIHFHRVHPKRKKNGKKTPACQLIEACYQYMAGNIPASEVADQQGDLVFLPGNDPADTKAKVEAKPLVGQKLVFESHRMVSLDGNPLVLWHSTAKTPKNRLGFVTSTGGIRVEHPEHEDIVGLDSGTYEIRRCRSWEANPKAIWSLTID